MDRNVRWLGLCAIVRATGVSLVLPFIALYGRNVLHLGYAEIGLLVLALGVFPLAIVPFGGAVADRLGRRNLIVGSLVAEAAAVLLVGWAMADRSLVGVFAGAGIVNVAGAVGGPAFSAYVADLATGSDRTQAFTWFRIGWNVGFTLGVFSGGSLIGFLGFSEVGLLAGAVLIASTALLAAVLEPTPYDRDRARGIPRPTATSEAGLGATWSLLARDRIFLAWCGAMALAQLAVGQWGTTFTLYANTVLGIPYAFVGLGLALNGVLVVVAQAPTTRAAIGHRHSGLAHLGVALYVAGFLLFGAVALVPALVLAGFFAVVFVLTMGENVLSIPMQTLPSNLAPPSEIGSYNGAFFALVGVGQVLAPVLGGYVLALGASPMVTWGILMLPAAPALLLSRAWVQPRLPEGPDKA